jgi:hypothetical protein
VAKQRGIKMLSMVAHEHVDATAAHSLYEALGYKRTEVAFIKEL